MVTARDPRRDIIIGREAELNRAYEVARSRREASQTLLITGPAGSGKSTLVEAALAGLDAEVLYVRCTPLGMHKAFETAMDNSGTFEQSERFRPVKDQLAALVTHAYEQPPSGVEFARAMVSVLRTLPPSERAGVVVFEDMHLADERTMEALAYFARQNHLYDVAYLMLGRSGYPYPNFEGLDHLRLEPLSDEAAWQAMSHWADLVVSPIVAADLNDRCDGVPLILREATATLTPAQLRGDVPLPLLLEARPAVDQCLADRLDPLPPQQLETLAAFSLDRALPLTVVQEALPEPAVAALVEQRLLRMSPREVELTQAALGWTAWHRLSPPCRAALARRLARSWSVVDQLAAVPYHALEGPLTPEAVGELRNVLGRTTGAEPARLREAAAQVAYGGTERLAVSDGLRWITAHLDAGHLGAAVEVWPAVASGVQGPTDLLDLVQVRGVLARLTGNPVLDLPSPAEVSGYPSLPPDQAFLAWVLAARGAVRAGATQQARRYIDQASRVGRHASLAGRSLWRLVDCEWHSAIGRPVSRETHLEALTRWCDHAGGQDWLDDLMAINQLAELGEYDIARQFLVSAEAVHASATGIAPLGLLAARLHLDLVQFRMGPARQTADELSRHMISPTLAGPSVRADVLRLHALTDWSGPAYVAVAERPGDPTADRRLAATRGYEALLHGDYLVAANLLRLAINVDRLTPFDPWELVADLVEAAVAASERAAAAAALASFGDSAPTTPAAAAAAARARALLAPAFDVRRVFAEALELSDRTGTLMLRGRALVAYARRLNQLGLGPEAEPLRHEAIALFAAQGLLGWQRHARNLPLTAGGAAPVAPAVNGQLSAAEQDVLRLLLEGRRNKEIAAELFVSLRTVEKMLTQLFRHFDVASKSELLARLRSSD